MKLERFKRKIRGRERWTDESETTSQAAVKNIIRSCTCNFLFLIMSWMCVTFILKKKNCDEGFFIREIFGLVQLSTFRTRNLIAGWWCFRHKPHPSRIEPKAIFWSRITFKFFPSSDWFLALQFLLVAEVLLAWLWPFWRHQHGPTLKVGAWIFLKNFYAIDERFYETDLSYLHALQPGSKNKQPFDFKIRHLQCSSSH